MVISPIGYSIPNIGLYYPILGQPQQQSHEQRRSGDRSDPRCPAERLHCSLQGSGCGRFFGPMFEEMYRTIGMFSIETPAKIEKP